MHFDATNRIGDLVRVTVDQVTPWSLQGRVAGTLSFAVL